MPETVFVVHCDDGTWDAACCDTRCGYGVHGLDGEPYADENAARRAATAHRLELTAHAAEPMKPDQIPAAWVIAARDAVDATQWTPDLAVSPHDRHRYDSGCAVCRGDLDLVLPVALAAAYDQIADHVRQDDAAQAERADRAEAAIARVRRLCDMTIAASVAPRPSTRHATPSPPSTGRRMAVTRPLTTSGNRVPAGENP